MSEAVMWHELYGALFRPINMELVKVWEYELKEGPAKINRYNPEIMATALRRLAHKKDRDGRTINATLDDVRSMIFEIMREKRAAFEKTVKNPECKDCFDTGFYCGCIFLFDAEDKKTVVGLCLNPMACGEFCPHKEQRVVCYDIAIPCDCQIGEKEIRIGKYENVGAIRKMQAMIREHGKAGSNDNHGL